MQRFNEAVEQADRITHYEFDQSGVEDLYEFCRERTFFITADNLLKAGKPLGYFKESKYVIDATATL